mmetsp:Transcript_2867/g.6141  ORF Transcript_2867/g.6141 Transcript_2867/m.6141 type:complete len:201 (-) Transcript_2867:143-745(-)
MNWRTMMIRVYHGRNVVGIITRSHALGRSRRGCRCSSIIRRSDYSPCYYRHGNTGNPPMRCSRGYSSGRFGRWWCAYTHYSVPNLHLGRNSNSRSSSLRRNRNRWRGVQILQSICQFRFCIDRCCRHWYGFGHGGGNDGWSVDANAAGCWGWDLGHRHRAVCGSARRCLWRRRLWLWWHHRLAGVFLGIAVVRSGGVTPH